jgi:hypothetical protein
MTFRFYLVLLGSSGFHGVPVLQGSPESSCFFSFRLVPRGSAGFSRLARQNP